MSSSDVTWENCTLRDLQGYSGGAVYAYSSSILRFIKSALLNNLAWGGWGGAILYVGFLGALFLRTRLRSVCSPICYFSHRAPF